MMTKVCESITLNPNTPSYSSQTLTLQPYFHHCFLDLVGAKLLGEQVSLLVVGACPFNLDVVCPHEVIDKVESANQIFCFFFLKSCHLQ